MGLGNVELCKITPDLTTLKAVKPAADPKHSQNKPHTNHLHTTFYAYKQQTLRPQQYLSQSVLNKPRPKSNSNPNKTAHKPKPAHNRPDQQQQNSLKHKAAEETNSHTATNPATLNRKTSAQNLLQRKTASTHTLA